MKTNILDRILFVIAVVAAVLAGLGVINLTFDGDRLPGMVVFFLVLGVAEFSNILDDVTDFVIEKVIKK